MKRVGALIVGFGLDLALGDRPLGPLPHPVVVMGKAIDGLEAWLRSHFPDTPQGQFRAGCCLALGLPVATWGLSLLVCRAAERMSPALGFVVQALGCWQVLALRGLLDESGCVEERLAAGDLEGARSAVGRIVGRDTDELNEAGIVRATVETVAENFSDGVVVPVSAMAVGGLPAALTYKAINTLDSMVGYRNEHYEFFGKASARLDDGANYLPSRAAALLWITAAALDGQDGSAAWRIWRRDRRRHPSPNSAQCEAACAGALNIQLGGPTTYEGVIHDKPTLGDDRRPVGPWAVKAARTTLLVAGVIAGVGAVGVCAALSGIASLLQRRR